MSVEEDTELRDLISQTLEANGCFAKLRAQLRASIYLTLDEDEMFQKKEFLTNKKLNTVLETAEGKLMFCIVREFLEYFDLDFAISIFEPETYMGSKYQYMGRYKLVEDLKLPNLEQESSDPILLQLINLCKLNLVNEYDNSVLTMNSRNESHSIGDENKTYESPISNSQTTIHSISVSAPRNLNETFDVKIHSAAEVNDSSSRTENHSHINNCNDTLNKDTSQCPKKCSDETCKEKHLIDFDKSIKIDSVNNKSDSERSKSLIDQTIADIDFSPPIVKDNKHSKFDTFEKLKLASPKSDKVKSNLSSLSDLPPLPISKSRSNDMLLPSLYTKEFKDKGNIKDIDKLFELEPLDNYEEDFISESEMELTISKQDEVVKNNSIEEIQNKQVVKKQNNSKINITKDVLPSNDIDVNSKKTYLDNNSTSSSVTSEDFDLNSNIDDILNSC